VKRRSAPHRERERAGAPAAWSTASNARGEVVEGGAGLIVSLLAQGSSVNQILDDDPALDREDIRACLAYAHQALRPNRRPGDRRAPAGRAP
jgi:hypothetical protein